MGKTKLFAELVENLELNTVIFVPNISLVSQTAEYFNPQHCFIV
jgi:superfamily II DNA or RNA helicase